MDEMIRMSLDSHACKQQVDWLVEAYNFELLRYASSLKTRQTQAFDQSHQAKGLRKRNLFETHDNMK